MGILLVGFLVVAGPSRLVAFLLSVWLAGVDRDADGCAGGRWLEGHYSVGEVSNLDVNVFGWSCFLVWLRFGMFMGAYVFICRSACNACVHMTY